MQKNEKAAPPCHSEPVTDVTGVGIRIPEKKETDCHDQSADRSRNDRTGDKAAAPCHSEPVTDVTGVGIRIPYAERTDCHDQSADWSRNDRKRKKAAEQAAFRQLSRTQKLEHIWIYYKWYSLLGVVALIILSSVLVRTLTKKERVLYVSYINSSIGSELDRDLTDGFLAASSFDPAKQELLVYRNLYLSENADVTTHETAYASRLKLFATIESKQLDLVLCSREAYDILSKGGYLLDLSEALQSAPELAAALSPFLVENEVILEDNAIEVQLGEAGEYRAVTETVTNAVDLSHSPRIASARFDEPVYLCFIANTPRLPTGLQYLAYLVH